MIRRGRFAPTPSGQLHIGNAFTALCAWLQIRQAGGQFVLRIEDIDKGRSRPDLMTQQIDDLRWLGLNWDEGPHVGGPFGPYEQRHREPRYEEALQQLHAKGCIYPCYCSRAELAAIASAPHGLSSEGPVYPGYCRQLSQDERLAKGVQKSPALRFAMPESMNRFDDAVAGQQAFSASEIGDFVVKRADGMFSYQLAVTVDDAAMGITDVLRGSDLLDSTPRQLALYAALDLTPPRYAHVALLGDAEGSRMSKRDKSLSIAALRAQGATPERLLGLLAHLAGWLAHPEPVSAAALIPCFHTQQLGKPMIRVTNDQLQWLY
ncbi:tRNA glutamyl-Q(34) synthetase GluQRS [Paenibacillus whitsoniae]|uniref:Glutamyl-Q tRNA(Asp) synthetase n=1 Tax=Paenibacillus whitsoniae TaxID=2496558 RepID=A0A3S0A997_9BACL|nr:tRNA glutamyl-Q(34) synthetase GluQRS [Paenibacillus whitsoniae]